MSLRVRRAFKEDLDAVMKVEESWPESERASREQFLARLEKFPEGFFVAELDGMIRGTMTSCLVRYEPEKPRMFGNWDEVTNQGYLYEPGIISDPNGLYLVSGVVGRAFRGRGIFENLVRTEVRLASEFRLSYVVAGAVIPGYDKYCRKYGEIRAKDYVFLKRGKRYIDPFMEMYRKLGFLVPDGNHVIENYYPDAASRGYAALVVRMLEQ